MTGATPSPDLALERPPGELEGEGPSADPGEKVALGVTDEVIGLYLHDATGVDVAIGNEAVGDEFAQPRSGEGVELVVVDAHTESVIRIRPPHGSQGG